MSLKIIQPIKTVTLSKFQQLSTIFKQLMTEGWNNLADVAYIDAQKDNSSIISISECIQLIHSTFINGQYLLFIEMFGAAESKFCIEKTLKWIIMQHQNRFGSVWENVNQKPCVIQNLI